MDGGCRWQVAGQTGSVREKYVPSTTLEELEGFAAGSDGGGDVVGGGSRQLVADRTCWEELEIEDRGNQKEKKESKTRATHVLLLVQITYL